MVPSTFQNSIWSKGAKQIYARFPLSSRAQPHVTTARLGLSRWEHTPRSRAAGYSAGPRQPPPAEARVRTGAEHVRRSGPRRPDDARRGAEERPSAPLRTRPSALTVPSPCRARRARVAAAGCARPSRSLPASAARSRRGTKTSPSSPTERSLKGAAGAVSH